jgi:hypothetical protein
MAENEVEIISEEELGEDTFEESFDEDSADGDEYTEEDYEEDSEVEEELFRENPLKALWIRLGEVRELLNNDN